jgi:glycosyltransferase involved in cell wall biosynthesis
MSKVAIDIRFLHAGMGRSKTSHYAIGGIGRVMLSRLKEIDPTSSNFSFILIVDSRRYSLTALKQALPNYKNFIHFMYRFYLLPGINPNLRRKIQRFQEWLNQYKIRSTDVDIVECHDEFWHVKWDFNIKKKYKSLVFVHAHVTPKWKDPLDLEYYLAGLRNSDHIVAVSNSVREELIQKYGFHASQISTIYHGIDKDTFKIIEKSQETKNYLHQKFNISKPYLIYVGSWGEIKNVDKIIASFNLFKSSYKKDIQLVLVGNIEKFSPSQTRKIRHLISESQYSRDIIEIGYLQDSDIVLLNNHAEAFLQLSEYEAFCQGVAEAMACGTPVIASKEVAVAKELGLADELISPNDIEAVSERIDKILSDSSYKAHLLKKQFQVVEKLSWKKNAEQVLDLYEKLMTM